jgi:hypothetical protein
MFDEIRRSIEFQGIECCDCFENNAIVDFDVFLKLNNELDENKVLILKPDYFYSSSRGIHNPPPAPDCLILVNCLDKKRYDLYLIELKDVKDTRELKYDNIVKKFHTMLNEFFVTFDAIFSAVSYGKIKFYLVTTYLKGTENLSEEDYRKRIKGSRLEAYVSQKPLKLYNQLAIIEPRASLTIMPC